MKRLATPYLSAWRTALGSCSELKKDHKNAASAEGRMMISAFQQASSNESPRRVRDKHRRKKQEHTFRKGSKGEYNKYD